jgi:hypothetical protein
LWSGYLGILLVHFDFLFILVSIVSVFWYYTEINLKHRNMSNTLSPKYCISDFALILYCYFIIACINWHWLKLTQYSTETEFIERTVSLRFLGIILSALRLEVSVYNVYITNPFESTFARGGGGGWWNPLVEVTVNSKEENSHDFCPNYV